MASKYDKGSSHVTYREKADQISAVINCYDRIVIQSGIPRWNFADGMTGYFHAIDYATFSQPPTQKVRDNAEQIVQENGIDIELFVSRKLSERMTVSRRPFGKPKIWYISSLRWNVVTLTSCGTIKLPERHS